MRSAQVAVLGLALLELAHAACSKAGADCTTTGCCENPDLKCFRKNDHWSACNATCAPKRVWKDGGWTDSPTKVWDCQAILPNKAAKPPACKDPKNDGEDCSSSGCCAKAGSICFQKDEHHSSCNATCTPYAKFDAGKWVSTTDPVWKCTVVKPVLDEGASANKCTNPTPPGQDCTASGCCEDPKMTCFKKSVDWSSCNATCTSNMMWADGGWKAQKQQVWDCGIIYPPAVPKVDCSNPVKDGADCSKSGCCASAGSTCFKKNDHWASCRKECWTNKLWEGGKWVEKDEQVWDCGVVAPTKATLLYDASATKQVGVQAEGWPFAAALALGIFVGGSVAAFRVSRRPASTAEAQE
mmetsp:Transcript_59037/g.163303  ORF Transcript_59037/g.163303 Transcript_59037/m.163303 type:complete len:354 (-) Transcript_59037:591-1652(-)